MYRLLVFDGDPFLWMGAYINKDMNNDYVMLTTIDKLLTEALVTNKADKYAGFIQGKDSSHRHKMFPDYKGTRPPKPDWFRTHEPTVREHLIHTWKFELAEGQETDDCLASVVEQGKGGEYTPIICSIDKDFNQLEGEIYNPRRKTLTVVSAYEAEYNIAKQLLTGDRVDNIQGLPGIGPRKAEDALMAGAENSPLSPLQIALEVYMKFYGGMQGLIEFSQTAIKITLKRDKSFVFNKIDVPEGIKALWNPENQTRQMI